jgi:hypothetical protein
MSEFLLELTVWVVELVVEGLFEIASILFDDDDPRR